VSNELLDLSNLREQMRERIRASFVLMIPDEQWDKLIDAEVKAFFWKGGRGEARSISDFDRVVSQELEKETRKRVTELLNTPGWQERYNQDYQPMASEEIEKLMIKLAPEMLSALFGGVMQSALQGIKGHIAGSVRY
jgi:hypothetical protein